MNYPAFSSPRLSRNLVSAGIRYVLFFLTLSAHGAETGKSPKEAAVAHWKDLWADCYYVPTPKFEERFEEIKKVLVDGLTWDLSVNEEADEIDALIRTTCVPWSQDPNSSTHLTDFRGKFGPIAESAAKIERTANEHLLPKFRQFSAEQELEAAKFHSFPEGDHDLKWSDFSCGKRFYATEDRITAQKKKVADKFEELRRKCVHAGDLLGPREQKQQKYGQGSAAPTAPPSGKHENPLSDIVGTDKAIRDKKKSEELLREK